MFPFVNLTSIFHKRFRIGTENWNEFPYSFHRYNCWVWCSITSSESLTEFFAGPKLVGSQTSPSLRSSHIFFIHAKAAWFRFLTTKKIRSGTENAKTWLIRAESSSFVVFFCFERPSLFIFSANGFPLVANSSVLCSSFHCGFYIHWPLGVWWKSPSVAFSHYIFWFCSN